MKMKKILFSLLLSCLFACSVNREQPQQPIKPNILFIAVDDLRPEFGAYGAKHIHSPNLDKLASQSMVFNRAYCNIPVCGSSRASLLSGLRPSLHRFPGNYDTYLSEDMPGVTSLPKHFKNNGYETISYGKIYHHADDDSLAWDNVWRPAPKNHSGWRDYQTEENINLHQSANSRGLPFENAEVPDTAYYDGRIAEKTIATLNQLKNQDSPFFLAVGFLKPHLPFNAPSKYWELYDRNEIALPANYQRPETTPERAYHNFGELRNYAQVPKKGPVSDEMAKELIHGYYACVSYTDAQIGKVLQALEENGMAENTIVILWGDHGWNLGDHQLWCKHCNFESSLHVPLMLKVPNETKGQRSNAIVEFIDIYPTLAELAGLSLPEHLEGESMVSLLRNGNRQKDYAIAKYYGGMTLIKDNWFYTEWIDEDINIESRMLFDHSQDTLELNNLAESEAHQEQVQNLSDFLHGHWGFDFMEDFRNPEQVE